MKNITKNRNTNYSVFLVAIALLLVVAFIGIVCLERPAIAQAASTKQYISEMRVFDPALGDYGSEAKKLTDAGYRIDEASNLLEGYDGQEMYLAYKTTSDPKKAITDFSLMNMKGPYSFAGYENMLKDVALFAEQRISYMASGIAEFRKNYNQDTPSAKYAYDMMNRYREDDSGLLVGDFILGVNGSNDTRLKDMVMQADPIILSTIDKCLAIASAPVGETKSWIEKLSELTDVEIEDARCEYTLDKKATLLKESIEPIAQKLKTYHEFYKIVYAEFTADSQAELDIMLKDPVKKERFDDLVKNYYGDDEDNEYETCSLMYIMLSSFKYENDYELAFDDKQSLIKPTEVTNGSLLDLFLRVLDDEFIVDDLYPMASVLSDVQVDMIYIAGMETSIMLCDNNNDIWKETMTELNDTVIGDKKYSDFKEISVYSGVDRTIYNPDGIALSDEASRRQNVDKEDTWYANNLDETTEWILRGVLAVSTAAFVGMTITLGVKVYRGAFQPSMIACGEGGIPPSFTFLDEITTFDEFASGIDDVARANQAQYAKANSAAKCKDIALSKKWSISAGYLSKAFKIAFAVVMFVFVVALTTYLIWELVEYYRAPVYTEKPRIIFHNYSDKKGKSVYVRYDAVVNQNKEMADVRNKNSKQWVVLYTSKDKNAGNPILADSIKFSYKRSDNMSSLVPVHRIGESGAYNIQDGETCSVYYKGDANAYPKTGSSFSTGAFTLALCGGLLGGAGVGFLVTWLIMKRKPRHTMPITPAISD